jgi:hypothetical protein
MNTCSGCGSRTQNPSSGKWIVCDECSHLNRRQDESGLIYFIQHSEGNPIKVGKSRRPFQRLRQLEYTHGVELHIIHLEAGGRHREKQLHWRFRDFRVAGEWFHPADDILQYITDALIVKPSLTDPYLWHTPAQVLCAYESGVLL